MTLPTRPRASARPGKPPATIAIHLGSYDPLDAPTFCDRSITQPVEIEIRENSAVAIYEGVEDEAYPSLDALLDAHTIDPDHLTSWLLDEGRDDEAQAIALATREETDNQLIARLCEEIARARNPRHVLATIARMCASEASA